MLFLFFIQATDGRSPEKTQCSSYSSAGCSCGVKTLIFYFKKTVIHSQHELIQYVSVIFHRYVLEKVDLVIVGAEGVVESGGIINKVGFGCESSGSGLTKQVCLSLYCRSC